MRIVNALFGATLASLVAACGNGAAETSSSSGSSSSSSSSSTGGMETPVRQVFVRNPWGTPPNNLLVDGDFELSIDPGTGQYGWIGLDSSGANQVPLVSETGGICRTGLRCARVAKGGSLLGRGTAAPNMMPHHASIFAKPATPPSPGTDPSTVCKGIMLASIIACDEGVVLHSLKAAPAPGSDGYCELSADVPGSSVSLCMYVQVQEDAILDNATLLPAPAAGKNQPFALETVDPAHQSAARAAATFVRTHMRFGRPAALPAVREDLR